MHVNVVFGVLPLLWPEHVSECEKFSKLNKEAKFRVAFVEHRKDILERVYEEFFVEKSVNISDFLKFNGEPVDMKTSTLKRNRRHTQLRKDHFSISPKIHQQ